MTLVQRLSYAWKQFKNERLYRRIETSGGILVTREGAETGLRADLADWSPGGLFIATKDVLPLEAEVTVEFSIGSGMTSALRLKGQVVRHQKEPRTGDVEGMGIMFTDFTQDGLLVLREFLSRIYTDEFQP